MLTEYLGMKRRKKRQGYSATGTGNEVSCRVESIWKKREKSKEQNRDLRKRKKGIC
jgi:hypothetical protein